MYKKLLIGVVATLVIFGLSHGEVMNVILSFTLAGIVPGTSFVIPFWLMMAIYCASVSVVVVAYVELAILPNRNLKSVKTQKRRVSKAA